MYYHIKKFRRKKFNCVHAKNSGVPHIYAVRTHHAVKAPPTVIQQRNRTGATSISKEIRDVPNATRRLTRHATEQKLQDGHFFPCEAPQISCWKAGNHMNPLHQAVMLLLIPLLVSTKHMIADIFTKAVDKGSFILFRDIIMNNNVSLREALSTAACGLHGKAGRLASQLAKRL